MLDVLNTIKDAFLSFFDVVGSVVEFVITIIKDLVYVIGLVGEFVLKIPDLIGWLPTSVIALIVSIFAVVVIYKIIGRE